MRGGSLAWGAGARARRSNPGVPARVSARQHASSLRTRHRIVATESLDPQPDSLRSQANQNNPSALAHAGRTSILPYSGVVIVDIS